MPRTARLVVPNKPHHVYSRACKGGRIFYTDNDYRKYLHILQTKARQYKAEVLAYCLMPDYVELIVVPHRRGSLSRVVGRTQFAYSRYLKARRNNIKELWAGRFQSCALGDDYLHKVMLYVEAQPVYSHIVPRPESYQFSSALAHIAGIDDTELLTMDTLPDSFKGKRWSASLAKLPDKETCQKIATYTQTGRPLGSSAFITELEKKFRRRLHPLPVGRPPKQQ